MSNQYIPLLTPQEREQIDRVLRNPDAATREAVLKNGWREVDNVVAYGPYELVSTEYGQDNRYLSVYELGKKEPVAYVNQPTQYIKRNTYPSVPLEAYQYVEDYKLPQTQYGPAPSSNVIPMSEASKRVLADAINDAARTYRTTAQDKVSFADALEAKRQEEFREAEAVAKRIATQGGNTGGSRETPNKVARGNDQWSNKVAWSSSELSEKQKDLVTYSVEVSMIFESLRTIATKALGRVVATNELDFIGNFGSPVVNNTQKISVSLFKPIDLRIMLTRRLVDGKLEWSADVGVTSNTPITDVVRLEKARQQGPLPTEPVTSVRQPADAEDTLPKRRKVRV